MDYFRLLLRSIVITNLSSTCQPVTRFTNTYVQAEFPDVQGSHRIFFIVLLTGLYFPFPDHGFRYSLKNTFAYYRHSNLQILRNQMYFRAESNVKVSRIYSHANIFYNWNTAFNKTTIPSGNTFTYYRSTLIRNFID